MIGNGKLWRVLLQRHLDKCTGANPIIRQRLSEIKRSMVIDSKGVPLGITVDAGDTGELQELFYFLFK